MATTSNTTANIKGQIHIVGVSGAEGGHAPIRHGLVSHPRNHVVGGDLGGGQSRGVPVGQVAVGHVDLTRDIGLPIHRNGSHGGEGSGVVGEELAGSKTHGRQLGGGKDRAERQKQGQNGEVSQTLFHNGSPLCINS